jgi:hypothetical protein
VQRAGLLAVQTLTPLVLVAKAGRPMWRVADKIGDAAFDHCNQLPVQPDIFADQRAGGVIKLGDAAALGVEDGVAGDGGRVNSEWSQHRAGFCLKQPID